MAKKLCELCQKEHESDMRFGIRLCQSCLDGYSKSMSGDVDVAIQFSNPQNFPNASEQAKKMIIGGVTSHLQRAETSAREKYQENIHQKELNEKIDNTDSTKHKHTWKIILFFLIMYISTAGELVETFARTGQELGLAYLIAFANLLPASAAMMAIPFLCRAMHKKKLSHKGGKTLCLLNSILLFLVPIILFNYALIGGISAIFFYFINKWIFVEGPSSNNNTDKTPPQEAVEHLVAEQINKSQAQEVQENCSENVARYCTHCGKKLAANSNFCAHCGTQVVR